MKFKYLVIVSLFAVANSASVFLNSLDIPVKVVYDEPRDSAVYKYHAKTVSNLLEKNQLSPDETFQAKFDHSQQPSALRNHDEKIQLTSAELLQADTQKQSLKSNVATGDNTSEALNKPNKLFPQIENIVYRGINGIKVNVEKYVSYNGETNSPVSPEQWKQLNSSIVKYLDSIRGSVKAENQNFLQAIAAGLQSIGSTFMQGFTTQQNGTQGDEAQRPGIGEYIGNLFTGGFQQISGNISNLANQSTILGDAPTEAPNAIQGFFNQFQQIVSGQGQAPINPVQSIQNVINGSSQNDPDSGAGGPLQAFQNFASNFGAAVGNINPFNQGQSNPDGQNDETTQSSSFQGLVQQAAESFGQVVNNFNPLQQGSTAASGSQADEASTQNPIIQAANNFGQIINNYNPFSQGPRPANGSQSDASQGGPFQVLQNVFSNINPFSQASTTSAPTIQEGLIQSGQNVASQVGQAINNYNPLSEGSTNSPLPGVPSLEQIQTIGGQIQEGLSNASAGNPLPIETIGNQVQQLVSNSSSGNPVQTIGNQVQQAFGNASIGNPIETIQNAAESQRPQVSLPEFGQIGEIPRPPGDLIPANGNPVEIIQSIGGQVSETINNVNPSQKTNTKTDDDEIMAASE